MPVRDAGVRNPPGLRASPARRGQHARVPGDPWVTRAHPGIIIPPPSGCSRRSAGLQRPSPSLARATYSINFSWSPSPRRKPPAHE